MTKWHGVKTIPASDPMFDVSVEVICQTGDGNQLWGYYSLTSGLWYRTDGKELEDVKRWRYGRGYDPAVQSVIDNHESAARR